MKFPLTAIEKKTISLAAAPRVPVADELHQSGPATRIIVDFFRGRHDLSPEETSQIIVAGVRQISVGDHEILPPVIVEISQGRTPGPAAIGDPAS